MLMQISCGCCEQPKPYIYCDYFRTAIATQYAPPKDALETISGSAITQVLPSSVADLADCNIYCLACFGRANGPPGSGQIMTLTSGQRTVIADWVNAGGKLLACLDYKDLYNSGGSLISKGVDSTFFTELATLISDAGGTLTFGAEDAVAGNPDPWPTSTFLSDSWTSGITGAVEYDRGFGSSITNGTQLFAPVTKNTIVKQQCGSGWVVVHGSQNSLWGNKDVSQGTPTGYTAMTQFLNFYFNL